MIWLLLVFFVPGGLNQSISPEMLYVINFPCEDKNIFAVIRSLEEGFPDHYNLLMPIPSWGTDLILTFDWQVTLELIKGSAKVYVDENIGRGGHYDHHQKNKNPRRNIYIVNDLYDRNAVHIKFIPGTEKVLNCKIKIRYDGIPFVQSIRLNRDHEICEHSKSGYFHNYRTQQKFYVPDIVSSAMSSEKMSGHPYRLLQLVKKSSYAKTGAPYTVSSTMSNEPGEKTDETYIVSSTMSNASEEQADAPNIVSSTMSNASEKQADAPNIVSSMMSNAVFSSTLNVTHSKEFSLNESCGKQKVVHTELIVHGQSANYGQWPWHAALFRIEQHFLRYICGGTLMSKTLVLTAGHCVSIRGSPVVPDALKVHLGKFNLFGEDIAAQVREMFRVIIHPKFDGFTLDNDIALLKLKSEVTITNYVQPACMWYRQDNLKFPMQLVFGTIAGWGFDHQDSVTSTLRQITIPIVSELDCLKSNPTFFHKKLNHNKFCGGFANGTSVCNGDSGGGLMVFVPDAPGTASGAWHVRGIVSLAPSRTDAPICDPYEYTIFTDVEKYSDWLLEYMK